VALLLSAAPAASAPDSQPELAALKKRLASVSSLSASFTQTRRWSALKDAMVTQGTFSWSRGGKLIWRTKPPAESELIVEGKQATMNYPALGTSQSFDFSAQPGMAAIFDSIAAVLQADFEKLAPLYELSVTRASPPAVALKPRSPELAKVISGIDLTFNAKLDLASVVMLEGGGDKTEISFTDQVSTSK
jgi:outer membrane lipoprotein-sorting protein